MFVLTFVSSEIGIFWSPMANVGFMGPSVQGHTAKHRTAATLSLLCGTAEPAVTCHCLQRWHQLAPVASCQHQVLLALML